MDEFGAMLGGVSWGLVLGVEMGTTWGWFPGQGRLLGVGRSASCFGRDVPDVVLWVP